MRRRYPITTSRLRPTGARPGKSPAPPIGRRVSLIALEEEIQLPAHHGSVALRRLKVIRIEQSAVPLDSLMAAHSPRSTPTRVPKQSDAATHRTPTPQTGPAELECRFDGKLVRLKSVCEMVTDEAGNFYEVSGGQLRPLGELVRDEHGRIFEVHRTDENANEKPNDSSTSHREVGSKTENENRAEVAVKPPAQPASAQAVPKEPSGGYSKIIADPGLYLKIPWARAKEEIARLVKHPERLSDDDEIECYAQIYEAQRTVPAAHVATAELGDAALHSQLHPLTRDKAQMLGAPQLFRPTRYPFETRASRRQIHAGQRVYRLWPVFDPTADRKTNSDRHTAERGDEQPLLRNHIPEQYLNPMHFRYSREEVLYDMKSALGTLPPESSAFRRWLFIYPLRFLKALMVSITSYRRIKKWRTMLEGKSPDEQLWNVTPPRGFSYQPLVRRWAEEMLGNCGYELGSVLIEWEIFWRRKSLEAS